VEALVNIGVRSGVEYHFNSPISQIQLSEDGKRATGVVFQDPAKEPLSADLVICNADLTYAYNELLPSTAIGRSLLKREASCSSISFYWALDKQFPELTAHNIFLAEDFKESFDSIFKKHLIPDQPSFYVNVPSRVDPSASPAGCDTVVVLVPVGHLFDSKTGTHKGAQAVPGVTQDWDTMVEVINTPPTWRDSFNLDRGAILGLSHSFFNVLSFRPRTKHPSIDDLYFVGASTHPGTGVPIVLAGAKLVTEQVLKDLHLEERLPAAAPSNSKGVQSGSPLDVIQGTSFLQWALAIFIVIITWITLQGRVIGSA
jgi:phytoene desaturase (3,4-didehydrolycopene-forming)